MRHVILNLHGIGAPSRSIGDDEALYWIPEAFLRAVVDLANAYRGRVRCDFTIDDGNLSDATIAAPLFAEQNISAQIFVLTSRLGQRGSLDAAALRDLLAMGQSIGSHGRDHVDWTKLDSGGLAREVHEPRKILAEITNQPIEAAGIPFGRYNHRVLNELRRAGFSRCYSSDGGAAHASAWPVARTSLRGNMTVGEVQGLIEGTEPVRTRLARVLKGIVKRHMNA